MEIEKKRMMAARRTPLRRAGVSMRAPVVARHGLLPYYDGRRLARDADRQGWPLMSRTPRPESVQAPRPPNVAGPWAPSGRGSAC
jgi:hypothetical protein